MSVTRRLISVLIVALLGSATLVAADTVAASPAAAADSNLFDAGMLITDSLFYDGNAMTADQVQAFLSQKEPSCGGAIPCLKSALVNSPSMAAETGLCGAYSGATNERASSVIARIGSACGISQKVLLVLLQKEQGLVTSTSPSQSAYDHATGFNCPDTAPCDPAFSGFFYQMWYGARQFDKYALNPTNYNFIAGRYNTILYNPNAGCGTSQVFIQNKATAGLYNYTPYQPNWAALNNLYGTGSACSSYGNRNFWAYYNDWFGSTNLGAGVAAINSAFTLAGGAAVLGIILAPLNCPPLASACSPGYTNGSIYWSLGTGARVVLGAKDVKYTALGGPSGALGYPASGVYTYADNGGGSAQDFQNGSIYESAAGAFSVRGAIRTAYFQLGGSSGWPGWPTAEQICGLPGAGCSQAFQNATIYGSTAGSGAVPTSMAAEFASLGGPAGGLGYPINMVYSYPDNGGGTAEDFVNSASIYSSTAGAFAVSGKIRTAYFAQGGSAGWLGWPIADQVCSTAINCSQAFQFGTVFASGGTSGAVGGPIGAAYLAAGGASGALGYPASPIYSYPENGGGTAQDFQNSSSIYSSAAGAFVVSASVRSAYFREGGSSGWLGWPTAAAQCGLAGAGCIQQFQFGSVTANSKGGGPLAGAIAAEYSSQGGPSGRLGYPTTTIYSYAGNGGGTAQDFQNGYSIYASSAGAFAVSGNVRSAYFREGGSLGRLGWPTGPQLCVLPAGGCTQTFQYGVVYALSSSVGGGVAAAIAASYTLAGGPTGALGYPTSVLYPYTYNGGGTAQDFQKGSIYASSAGAFPVLGSIRDAYFQSGGSAGTYAWPTASQVCGTTCSQTFQGGTIQK